jgi:hypothetical protein
MSYTSVRLHSRGSLVVAGVLGHSVVGGSVEGGHSTPQPRDVAGRGLGSSRSQMPSPTVLVIPLDISVHTHVAVLVCIPLQVAEHSE